MKRTFAAALFALFTVTAPAHAALSLTGAVQTLDEEFKSKPQWREGGVQVTTASPRPLNDPSFSWAAGYIWDHPPVGAPKIWPPPEENFPAWTSNGQADADPNGDMIAQIGDSNSPFAWQPGTLTFIARKMPPDLAATVDNPDPHDYISASINSFPYSQRYGVFAMSARVASGDGLWPAFWLLPVDKSWPPEIDIMEVIGRQPTTLYTTVHTDVPQKGTAHGFGTDAKLNLSAGFHEYAVDWGPDRLDWYFDGKLVFSQPTPPDLHKPCYIIINLSVGKPNNWGGAPDETTTLPAEMKIKYIKAWQRPSYAENARERQP